MLTTLVLAALMASLMLGAAQALTVIRIPTPHSAYTLVDLNSDGSAMALNNGGVYYRWTPQDWLTYLGEGHYNNISVGISPDGTKVVGVQLDGDFEMSPSVWTQGSGWSFVPLPTGNSSSSDQKGSITFVTNDGTTGGMRWYSVGAAEAFTWDPVNGPVVLERLAGSTNSRATRASNDGSLVIGWDNHPDMGYRRPVYWEDGGPLTLFMGKEGIGQPTDVSSDGSLIVGMESLKGFIYDRNLDTVTVVPPFNPADPGQENRFNAVSDDTTAVGWNLWRAYSYWEAGIYTPAGGWQNLQDWVTANGGSLPSNVHLSTGLDISDDGTTIAAAYYTTGGVAEMGIIYISTNVIAGTPDAIPARTARITGAAPNPFNPQTSISFELPSAQAVEVGIYDLQGRLVRTLVDGHRGSGGHTVRWDGRDADGRGVPSAVYLVRLRTADTQQMQKITLMK